MSLSRSSLAAAAALTATSLLATACSGKESSGASTPQRTLSISILGTPPSLDLTQLDLGQGAYIWSGLLDTLLYTDNKGQVQPNAAESYSYSADRKTLTLKLRKGMTFSNGKPVNAAAAKASLERIRTMPGPSQAGLGQVASIETPDESTVVLKLKKPDGALLTELTQADGAIEDPATLARPSSATDPVGSGPYVLDRAKTVNGSVYTLTRRKGYWNAAAFPFDTVRIRVMSDRSAVVNALMAGELNAGSVEWPQLPALKAKGLTVKTVPGTALALLFLADRAGTKLKPLGDPRVRQAINMALDRPKLTSTFLKDAGQPSDQVFNSKSPAYDPALDKEYPFDVAKARNLLADAGYSGGFAIDMPSFPTTKVFEPSVAQALSDIGIKVSWTPVPLSQQSSVLQSGKYPIFLNIYGSGSAALAVRNFLSTDGTAGNPFKSSDRQLATYIEQANTAGDPAQATAAYKKINEFVVKNAWFAPLFQIGTNWVTAKGVSYLGDGSSNAPSVRDFGVAN